MKLTFIFSIFILISCAGTQVKNSVNKEKQLYIQNQVESLLSSARQNHQNYILELKKKGKNRKSYKYKSLKQLKKAFKILKKNKPFLTKQIINDYNKTAKLINSEIKDFNLSLTNFLLIPFRYIANIGKGITDIFVFKFGYGLGAGGAIIVLSTGLGATKLNRELSTAYSPEAKMSRISDTDGSKHLFVDLKKWNGTVGTIIGGYSVCSNDWFGRTCGGVIDESSELISYTNVNVWVGLGPAFMLNIETHRFVELFGVFLGQDWNITQNEADRTRRFHYFSYKKAKIFYDKKQVLSLTQE